MPYCPPPLSSPHRHTQHWRGLLGSKKQEGCYPEEREKKSEFLIHRVIDLILQYVGIKTNCDYLLGNVRFLGI